MQLLGRLTTSRWAAGPRASGRTRCA